MVFSSEVKDFIRNTLILTLFFTLVLHLSWGYIWPMLGLKTSAGANDLSFQQADMTYMGNIATAMSLSIGQKEIQMQNAGVDLTSSTISIAEVLSSPTLGQQRLIGSNMLAVSSYANILSTDIVHLLDSATDRQVALTEHISLLKSYYNKTLDRLSVISDQIWDLQGIISQSASETSGAKTVMQSSYEAYDYSGVDGAIDSYIGAKNRDTRARVYLIYLERFQKSYTALQVRNLKLIDALSNNRDALIKRSTIVIPDSGTDIIRTLKLIQTEAEASAQKALQ
jgi:hypothetical protein